MAEYAGVQEERVIADEKATLDGLGESVVVEVFNPLSMPFRAQFARSLPVSAQLSDEERRLAALSGVPAIKDGGGVGHVKSYIVVEPGKTMKLPANVAQNVVRQMVTYIIQQRGNKGLVSDPHLRREVEEEIIVNYHSIVEAQTLDSEEQFQKQLAELNNPDSVDNVQRILQNETAFPTERVANESPSEVSTEIPESPSGMGSEDSWGEARVQPAKRPVGRPKTKA